MEESGIDIMPTQLGRRIIAEIINKCAKHEEIVNQELAAYIIRIISINPDTSINIKSQMTPEEEDTLVQKCCDLILAKNNPSIDTVKMQVQYEIAYKTRRNFAIHHSKLIKQKVNPVISDIMQTKLREPRDFASLEEKLITYFLLKTGLASSTDDKVRKEISETLSGLLPHAELRIFVELEEDLKKQQLDVVAQVLTGVCIYYGRYKNGSISVDHVLTTLKEATPSFHSKLTSELQQTRKFAEKMTSFLEKYLLKSDSETWSEEVKKTLDLLIEVLINTHQYQVYLTTLLKEVDISISKAQELSDSLKTTTLNIHGIITSAMKKSMEQCLPSFSSIYRACTEIQDEVLYLGILSTFASSIQKCVKNSNKLIDEEKVKFLEENYKETKRIQDSRSTTDVQSVIAFPKETTVFYPVSIQNFSKLQLQYHGFCPWTIWKGNGALLPANRELGVVMFREKCYGFACEKGRNEFLKQPEGVIAGLVSVAKTHPSLILFLQLHDRLHVPFERPESSTHGASAVPKFVTEKGTETDVQFEKRDYDAYYRWNEWDLRREALITANLKNKRTHSTQTDVSHFRHDNHTQTWSPKNNSCQTKRDSSTSMSRYTLSNHIPM